MAEKDIPVQAYLDKLLDDANKTGKKELFQHISVNEISGNMNEKVFYNRGGIIVTRSRVIIGATTYSVNLISQVQLVYEDIVKTDEAYAPAVSFGTFLFFVAPLSVFTVEPDSENMMDILIISCLISLIGFCIGIYYGTISKSKVKVWHILLFTNSSQIKAYKSENKQEVIDIILAINQAIMERG